MKEKRKVLTLLAAAALAVSVPGNSADVQASSNTFRVNVATGYLALRNDTSFDTSNEIGELYTGDLVEVADYTGATGYWYVYSPKYDRYGYVNNDYLDAVVSSSPSYSNSNWTVSVDKGYLALRTARKPSIPPTRSASFTPAIQYVFLTAAIPLTGMYILPS